jgi:hypothetical protein
MEGKNESSTTKCQIKCSDPLTTNNEKRFTSLTVYQVPGFRFFATSAGNCSSGRKG